MPPPPPPPPPLAASLSRVPVDGGAPPPEPAERRRLLVFDAKNFTHEFLDPELQRSDPWRALRAMEARAASFAAAAARAGLELVAVVDADSGKLPHWRPPNSSVRATLVHNGALEAHKRRGTSTPPGGRHAADPRRLPSPCLCH
jgi:hypothetical protein